MSYAALHESLCRERVEEYPIKLKLDLIQYYKSNLSSTSVFGFITVCMATLPICSKFILRAASMTTHLLKVILRKSISPKQAKYFFKYEVVHVSHCEHRMNDESFFSSATGQIVCSDPVRNSDGDVIATVNLVELLKPAADLLRIKPSYTTPLQKED